MLINSILNKLHKYEAVSFDVYDTLVKRNVKNPEDVFQLVEKKYNSSNNRHITNFKMLRIKAYKEAEKKAVAKVCNMDDIYKEIHLPNEIKKILQQLETRIEMEICTPNKDMVDLLHKLREQGKEILIISDMYLSGTIIRDILKECGVADTDYDGLYVSSEWGCRKMDGGLFQKACGEKGISMDKLIHVGDNWKNDYVRALLCGIKPIHVPAHKKNIIYYSDKGLASNEKFLYRVLNSVASNLIHSKCSEFEKLGIETLGIYMYGFTTWLYQKLKQDGIQKVFFLAREGNIIKKSFEILYPDSDLKIEYMYASRRSVIIPSYWVDDSYVSICNSMSRSMHMTLDDFFYRLNLGIKDYVNLLTRLNIPLNYTYDGSQMEKNRVLEALYDELKNDVVKNSREEYEKLEKYLKQIGFLGGISAIVDVGWNGGMQKALEKLPCVIESSTQVYGYYFGINSSMLGTSFNHAKGYIYENGRNLSYRYYIYGFAGPLEMALSADHGSTCSYEENGTKVVPRLLSNEYRDENGQPSKELEYVLDTQKGIIEYLREISEQKTIRQYEVSVEVAFRNYFRFATQPLLRHIRLYEGFEAVDLKSRQVLISRQYKRLFGKYSIINGLRLSTWKIGFMKHIFKLPFPYKDIYLLLRKRRD